MRSIIRQWPHLIGVNGLRSLSNSRCDRRDGMNPQQLDGPPFWNLVPYPSNVWVKYMHLSDLSEMSPKKS